MNLYESIVKGLTKPTNHKVIVESTNSSESLLKTADVSTACKEIVKLLSKELDNLPNSKVTGSGTEISLKVNGHKFILSLADPDYDDNSDAGIYKDEEDLGEWEGKVADASNNATLYKKALNLIHKYSKSIKESSENIESFWNANFKVGDKIDSTSGEVEILDLNKDADYILVKRPTDFQAYVSAWAPQLHSDGKLTWGQGHYFDTEEGARQHFSSKLQNSDKLTESYEDELGGDPEDFISDLENIKETIYEIDTDKFGSKLATQLLDDFLLSIEDKISETKESYNLDHRLDSFNEADANDRQAKLKEFADSIDLTPLYNKLKQMSDISNIEFSSKIIERPNDVYIDIKSNDLIEHCGVLKLALSECHMETFNSGIIESAETHEPYWWGTMDFRYQSRYGGFNGVRFLRFSYNENPNEWIFNEE